MRYKAEIFDKYQYLYEVTRYSDHQVHCLIYFESKVDAAILKRAAELLIKSVPILTRTYKSCGNSSHWEDTDISVWEDLFTVTDNKDEFDNFTLSKTNAETGPQIKFCLLQKEKDCLSVVINHMVSDGGGFKQCMYLFSELYSNLLRDPDYIPERIIDGDRSFKDIIRKPNIPLRIGMLLFGSKDNNQKSTCEFPMSKSENPVPFLVSHEIPKDLFRSIKNYCRASDVTVNDVVLTAYFRALSVVLDMIDRELAIPIMIDMRRYLNDKGLNALTNLSSTSIVKTCVAKNEDFFGTLSKINSIMKVKKSGNLGLNTFLKLNAGFKIPFVDAYSIMAKVLKHPKLSMTNIGILDSSRLVFVNSPIENAVMFSSKKYQPYLQLSVTSFNDKMTLGFGQYGSKQDRNRIEELLNCINKELSIAFGPE